MGKVCLTYVPLMFAQVSGVGHIEQDVQER